MHYVYSLRSSKNKDRFYIGLCDNIHNRLEEHNAGECKATADARPWRIEAAFYFRDENKVHAFERYLKTGSGRAFSKRHF
jgi:putative endonuclease